MSAVYWQRWGKAIQGVQDRSQGSVIVRPILLEDEQNGTNAVISYG